MKAEMSAESYGLVCELAYKFAYSTTSIEYEEYVSRGIDGLAEAIATYKDDKDTAFKSYATTCIKNAMCTSMKRLKRFDLVQDENKEVEQIDGLAMEMQDDNMVDVAKKIILKANHNNERNAEMFMLNIGLVDAPMDYKELSAKFNVSAERVRQLCVNTRAEIKKNKHASELLYSFVG